MEILEVVYDRYLVLYGVVVLSSCSVVVVVVSDVLLYICCAVVEGSTSEVLFGSGSDAVSAVLAGNVVRVDVLEC